ncbi:unnamed protein product [Gongylonema pulchrum]|uniref:SLC3A2_N domain-containing protein n=1 Tax=Gongylonema pulchrum TaxID=637853 RepID=A0A183D597_9BILA|nr:unnamed protein product [Gongylonema pulchrum]
MCSGRCCRTSTDVEESRETSRWNTANSYEKIDQLEHRLRHFWSWRVILAFFTVVIVIIVLTALILSDKDYPEETTDVGTFVPLNDLRKRTVASFKLRRY